MACSNCNNPKAFAAGLCSGCYSRLRRRGTLARKNVDNRGVCSEIGCERGAFSKGLCGLHYQRAQHPLSSTWRSLRSRASGAYPIEWNRFEAFLNAVGERPTPHHQLRRVDSAKPWSVENLVWRDPIGVGTTANAREYAWRWHLRKKYDLTVEDVAAILAFQGGRCAMCPHDFSANAQTGQAARKMCIDHDHITDLVRGILCDDCNKALGGLQDDSKRLATGIIYLARAAGSPSTIEEAIKTLSTSLVDKLWNR